jgi:glycoside/pentoside/hexuronide:cation symporter, GPH family
MYASGIPVAIAYYFLWSPPAWDENMLFLYFVSMAVLIRTLITFYEIPATALVAELTDDYDQRTEMMSFRYFFAWWGGLTMAILNYLVFLPEEKGGLEYVQGWQNYGLAASIIIFLSIIIGIYPSCASHHPSRTLTCNAPLANSRRRCRTAPFLHCLSQPC